MGKFKSYQKGAPVWTAVSKGFPLMVSITPNNKAFAKHLHRVWLRCIQVLYKTNRVPVVKPGERFLSVGWGGLSLWTCKVSHILMLQVICMHKPNSKRKARALTPCPVDFCSEAGSAAAMAQQTWRSLLSLVRQAGTLRALPCQHTCLQLVCAQQATGQRAQLQA